MISENGKIYIIDYGQSVILNEKDKLGNIIDLATVMLDDIGSMINKYINEFILNIINKFNKSERTRKIIDLIESINSWLKDRYPERYIDLQYNVRLNSSVITANDNPSGPGYKITISKGILGINILKSWLNS